MGKMNIFNEDTTADKLEIQFLLIQLNKINLFLVRTCIKFYLVITIRYKEFLPRWTTSKKCEIVSEVRNSEVINSEGVLQ